MFCLENVLGEEILGLDVVSGILTETRLSTGAVCVTIMKELLQKFTEHCKNIYVQNMSIIEADSVLTEIGDVSRDDLYENQFFNVYL